MLAAGRTRLVLSRATVTKLTQNGAKILGVGPLQIPVATMRATHGEKYPYSKPWPYETKKYGVMHHLLDSTSARLNENSKVIVVEGNVAVGKHDFAKKLAEEFDLKMVPATPDARMFQMQSGKEDFDWRTLNDFLPENLKGYDLKRFLCDPNPERGRAGLMVNHWFVSRCRDYCLALAHLLNTGQGVVIVKSPYSDNVYSHAMRQMGWVTRPFIKYFRDIQEAALCDLLHPHLTIYLDASIPTIRERINKRNNSVEMSGVNLTDEYLTQIDKAYKNVHLPSMKYSGRTMILDWETVADRLDMDAIAEEISLLELDPDGKEDVYFPNWAPLDEEEFCSLRSYFGTPGLHFQENFKDHGARTPFKCPEILMNDEEAEIFHDIVLKHPAVKHRDGWSDELGEQVIWKI